jgi:hypothetical protein
MDHFFNKKKGVERFVGGKKWCTTQDDEKIVGNLEENGP